MQSGAGGGATGACTRGVDGGRGSVTAWTESGSFGADPRRSSSRSVCAFFWQLVLRRRRAHAVTASAGRRVRGRGAPPKGEQRGHAGGIDRTSSGSGLRARRGGQPITCFPGVQRSQIMGPSCCPCRPDVAACASSTTASGCQAALAAGSERSPLGGGIHPLVRGQCHVAIRKREGSECRARAGLGPVQAARRVRGEVSRRRVRAWAVRLKKAIWSARMCRFDGSGCEPARAIGPASSACSPAAACATLRNA